MGENLPTRLLPLVQEIADHLISEVQGPYALFGHSMGAAISFELARELRRRGDPTPVHLFLAGRPAPHWPRLRPETFALPHHEFLKEVRRLNGTSDDFLDNPELLEFWLPVIRADFELVETYSYKEEEPLSCSISAYGGLRDEDCPLESIRAWSEHTSAKCTARMFPGDHFFLHLPNFLPVLAHDVEVLLANLETSTTR